MSSSMGPKALSPLTPEDWEEAEGKGSSGLCRAVGWRLEKGARPWQGSARLPGAASRSAYILCASASLGDFTLAVFGLIFILIR